MAGMCCGIKVAESEPASPVESTARTARRRRMELRQIRLISDIAETTARLKRRKVEEDQQRRQRIEEGGYQSPRPHLQIVPTPEIDSRNDYLNFFEVSTEVEDIPKFGFTSVCGRRREMEDAVSVRPSFWKRGENREHDGFHFYGVFDGHGCSHVAMKCKERMHAIIKEEIEKRGDDDDEEWKETMSRSFIRMDREVGERLTNNAEASTSCRCELQTPECDAVGSTAVVAVVTPEKIVVSNCGDSRAVLCRKGVAIPLSSDHKPDRPDELNRIEEAGGRVIYWDGARVLGMLAMSRAIGDNYLKPYVIPDPEVTVTDRSSKDECLILASDGLWDVVSNETAAAVARMCLINAEKPQSPPRSPDNEAVVAAMRESSDKACSDASILLTKLALARQSTDNVSVLVVDLRR